MNVVLQYVVTIIGLLIAHKLIGAIADAIAGLGLMGGTALRASLSPRFKRELNEGVISENLAKGIQRTQLISAVPASLFMLVAVLATFTFFAWIAPAADWIPALWALVMVLSALSIIGQGLWWFLKSYFISSDQLAAEMAAKIAKEEDKK